MKKKILLITGGSGYIGSILFKRLEKKFKVIIVDRKQNKFLKKKNFVKIDLSKKSQLKKIQNYKIETVIHLAAQSTIDLIKNKKNSYLNDNIQATKNVINFCKDKKIKKLIFSSTASVYKKSEYPLKEQSKLLPNNLYGRTKLANEKFIKQTLSGTSTNYCILRFFNVCSSDVNSKIGEFHNPETHLIPILIHKIYNNKTIKIYGKNYKTSDGTCVRDYIHILDIVSAIEKSISFLNKKKSEIFNLGSNKGFTVMQIISEVEKKLNIKSILKITKRRHGDNDKSICNIKKAKKFLLWKPKFSKINKIIDDEIFWFNYLQFRNLKRKFFY
jgi:UDP-glucose 4-epimerase